MDSAAENGAFRDKYGFPFDLLCDEDGSMSTAYGAASGGRPKRVSYLIGADGTIEKAYADVKPADHPDEVLADLGA